MTAVLIKMREIRERLRLVHGHLDGLIGSYTPDSKVGEVSGEASLLDKLVNELDIVECQVGYLAERVLSVCSIIGGSQVEPTPSLAHYVGAGWDALDALNKETDK